MLVVIYACFLVPQCVCVQDTFTVNTPQTGESQPHKTFHDWTFASWSERGKIGTKTAPILLCVPHLSYAAVDPFTVGKQGQCVHCGGFV